jgi:hypothetical protein
MARGWESKSVEDQVQEAQTKTSNSDKPQFTASQQELRRRKEVLLLSRARVERELQSNPSPRYKDQLTHALGDLNAQLAELAEQA